MTGDVATSPHVPVGSALPVPGPELPLRVPSPHPAATGGQAMTAADLLNTALELDDIASRLSGAESRWNVADAADRCRMLAAELVETAEVGS